MIAYKVAIERYGRFYSYGVGLFPEDALCLEYEEGKIVQACEGTVGIFLFKELDDAYRYGVGSCSTIFKVETLAKVKEPTKVIANSKALFGDMFKVGTYKIGLNKVNEEQNYDLPYGMILCMKIKVLERLPKPY